MSGTDYGPDTGTGATGTVERCSCARRLIVRLMQTQRVVMAIGDFMGITCHACIGGTSVHDDAKRIESGAQIVVGTPGRVYDMISRSILRKCFACYPQLQFSMVLCSIRRY